MTLEEFALKALPVPFVEHGRDYDGWDCWGLVRCGLRDVMGIELPSYAGDYGSTERLDELQTLVEAHRDPWHRIDLARAAARPCDVVLLRVMGRACHVGLLLDGHKALHTEARRGTFVEDLRGAMWAGKIEGVYRHERLV